MVNPKLQNLITKYIDRRWSVNGEDYEEYISELKEILDDDFNYKDVIEGIFTYIIEKKNEDPFKYFETEFLEHNFYENEVQEILNDSGWLDNFFTIERFIKPSKENKSSFNSVYRDIITDGNRLFLICDGWSDLSVLFHPSDKDWVERILGEDWADIYSYFDVDFENDVKDELDEKSIQHIRDYIKEGDYIGKPIEVLDVEYGEILTEEDLIDVDTLFHLIDEEPMFYDLKNGLEGFYRWAYESAAEDELFGELKDEIEGFFKSKGDWDNIVTDKNKHVIKFDITDMFMEINKEFLECTSKFPNNEYNWFIEVIEAYFYCSDNYLNVPNMDYFYPDSTKVSEHLNYNVLSNL